MARQITITLPDEFEFDGLKDAPEQYKRIKTEHWTEEFILAALRHGTKQPLVDTWSTSKKDVEKLKDKHESFSQGEWTRRERTGASAVKFDEAIKKLNVHALAGKLTREQIMALAAVITPDGEVKF